VEQIKKKTKKYLQRGNGPTAGGPAPLARPSVGRPVSDGEVIGMRMVASEEKTR
jgi:hypothetical protein